MTAFDPANEYMLRLLRAGPVRAKGSPRMSGDAMRQAVRRLRQKGYKIDTVSVYVLAKEP